MSAPGGGDYNANVVLTANVGQYQQAMGGAQQSTEAAHNSVEKLLGSYGRLKEATRTKFISWDKEAAITLSASVAAAGLFEKQLSTLSATAAVTGKSMGSFRDAINGAFARLPVARGDLTALATQLNQLGVTGPQDIGKLLDVFTKLGAVTGAAPTELAASMLQFTQSMGDTSVSNIKAMADQLVTLSKNAGVSAQSVLNFAQAIEPLARVAGISGGQVLSLSTAFSKAGADGYVAANTFNSMLADITQLAASGSPQLAKYANSLGMTTDQFKKLPAANAVAALFDQVNKEGKAGINTLNQWGINGVRAITSVQQVAQSGQLDKLLTATQGGVNGSLDKGAAAAMGGLSDALAETRNQFTMYGTYLGQHVIGPTTTLVHVINTAVRALGLLKPVLAPVLGLVGFGGQVLGSIAGLASPLLMGAWVARSPIGRNLRAGWNVGRATRTSDEAGVAARERYAAAGVLPRDEAGNIMAAPTGPMSRMFFTAGMTGGSYTQRAIFGESGQSQRGLVMRNMLIRLPGMGARALMSSQEQYQRNAANPAGFEAPMAERAVGALQRATVFLPGQARSLTGRVGAMFGDAGTASVVLQRQAALEHASRIAGDLNERGVAPSTPLEHAAVRAMNPNLSPEARQAAVGHVGRSLNVDEMTASMTKGEKAVLAMGAAQDEVGRRAQKLTAKLNELIDKAEAMNTTEGKANSALQTLQSEIHETVKAMGSLAVETTRASTRVLGQAAGAAASRAVPAVVSGAGNLAKSLLTNPWTYIATAPMLFGNIMGRVHDRQDQTTDITGKYLNPIQKYNEQLGIATTNLASLANAAASAAGALTNNGTKITASTPMAQVQGVTHADDIAARQQGSSKDANITTLHQGKGGVGALANYLQTLDMNDPRQVQQFKINALAAGYSDVDVRKAISQGMSSQTKTNFTALGSAAIQHEGLGLLPENTSISASKLFDSAQTKILNDYTKNQTRYGTAYGSQVELQNVLQLTSAAGSKVKGFRVPDTAGSGKKNLGDWNPNDPKGADQESNRADIQKKQMAQMLATQFHGDWSTYYQALLPYDLSKRTDAQRQQLFLDKIIPSTKEGKSYLSSITAAGGSVNVSQFANVDSKLRTQGSRAQTKAALAAQGPLGAFALTDQAVQSSAAAPADPAKFNQAMKDLATEALRVGKNFSGGIDALEKMKGGIQDTTNATYQAADAAQQWLQTLQQSQMAQMGRAGQGAAIGANLQKAQSELAQGAPDAGQKYQAAQGAFNDWANSQNNWMIQMAQTAKAFDTQMTRSDEDYNESVKRTTKANALQLKNSDADYRQQRARSYADFNKQMKRMAEDEAKSAYDPFSRIQSKFTIDASTLSQNLGEQNQALEQQQAQLAQARKLGLSKQAIQQLNLADPQQAQQLNNIIATLKDDPRLAARINAQIATRVRASSQLAASQYNQTYQRTVDDFRESMNRTAHDYNVQRQRAVDAQALSLDYMASDYDKMVRRAGEDLNTSMTEIYSGFSDSYGNAMQAVDSHVEKWAPKAASTMRANLKVLDPYIKFVQANGGILTPGALISNPYLPNQLGINSSGQIGRYTAAGKWEPNRGYLDPAQEHGLPQIRNPVTGHATGGISTFAHTANISEGNKAEAIIPLDQRGLAYMTSFYRSVARELVLTMGTAGHPGGVAGHRTTSTVHQDFSTRFTGNIKVVANDSRKLMEELAAKARLAKLTRPTHR